MSIESDYFWGRQADIVERFATWLEDDFTIADAIYQQMRDEEYRVENDIREGTFLEIKALYKIHVKDHSEQCREDMITRNLIHVWEYYG